MSKKVFSLGVVLSFFLTILTPLPLAHANTLLNLPQPGSMINLSPTYEPAIIKGLTIHQDNPFLFDFLVDVGQDKLAGLALKKEGEKLIKYFLASLAIPDQDVWVNLSPYENARIIPKALGQTDMGRDLLAEDYVLKQITASLIYPETKLGKIFWGKVYKQAQAKYGTTQVPVNTFNKVWILADRAEIFEHDQTAFVVAAHMKVMLEEDYLAFSKHVSWRGMGHVSLRGGKADEAILGPQIIRSIILPELEKEVNTGKNFANLRQILNSLILANWYKKNLKEALLNQVYTNRAKVKGINLSDPTIQQQIYDQYLKAYRKGVFNYIKEEPIDSVMAGSPASVIARSEATKVLMPDTRSSSQSFSAATVTRKYFSGGFVEAPAFEDPTVTRDGAQLARLLPSEKGRIMDIQTAFLTGPQAAGSNAAMVADLIVDTPAEELIQGLKNPYLEGMIERVHALLEGFPKLTEAIKEITNRESEDGDWKSMSYQGQHLIIYYVRVKNNRRLGPAKGGLRYLAPSDLNKISEFKDFWQKLEALGPNEDDVKAFISQWINQEAEALAMGMTLKNAGINLNLGGGKGAVFVGIIKHEAGRLSIQDYPGWKDDKVLQAKIARIHSRSLAEKGLVGIDIDIPAPDMNTNGTTLSIYEDEYLRHIALNTEEIQTALPDLSAQLKAINPSDDPMATPFLDAVAAYSLNHPDTPVPWLGVYTGKPVAVDGIYKGGVQGRGPATGEGICDLIEEVFGQGLEGQTVAIQGFGNVAQPIGPRLAKNGAKVVVISDGGGTYINPEGFSRETLERLIEWKSRQSNPYIFIRDVPAEFFDKRGLEIVEGSLNDPAAQEARRKAVLEADVDILIPAALEGEITEKNAANIKASFIFEGANGPTTVEAEKVLYAKGKTVFPDTLGNSGGVFVSSLETEQATTGRRLTSEEVAKRRQVAIVTAYQNLKELNWRYPRRTFRRLMDVLALRRIQERIDGQNNAAMSAQAVPSTDLPSPSSIQGNGHAANQVRILLPKEELKHWDQLKKLIEGKPPEISRWYLSRLTSKVEEIADLYNIKLIRAMIKASQERGNFKAGFLSPDSRLIRHEGLTIKEMIKEGKPLQRVQGEDLKDALVAKLPEELREALEAADKHQIYGDKGVEDHLANFMEAVFTLSEFVNAAMSTPTRGGIDLNTSNSMQWQVHKDGMGVVMHVDAAMIERIKKQGIDSLSPVIYRMTPVDNIWARAGVPAPA